MTDALPQPWCDCNPRGMQYLRHRLAFYSNAEIAAHYGVGKAAVKKLLNAVFRQVRGRWRGKPITSVADVIVLAAQSGVTAVSLARRGPGATESDVSVDAPELAHVG